MRSARPRSSLVVALGAALSVALVACGLSVVGSLEAGGSGGDGGAVAAPADAAVRVDASGTDADVAPAACHALEFDGMDDFVEVADASDLDPAGQSTVEAWVLLKKDTSNELHVVSHHDHGDQEGYLLMAFGYARDGGTPAALGGSTRYYDGNDMNQVGFGSGSLMPVGQWVHLAATYDGAAVRLYVNGKVRGTKGSLPLHPNADFDGPLHIGRNALQQNFHWGGLIDEVRISRVARYGAADFTPADRFTSDADTIALWHFDEGSGATVTDVAGTHPGTIRGATWAKTASCGAR